MGVVTSINPFSQSLSQLIQKGAVMKLYIYANCPFCDRVSYVGRKLNIEFEEVVVDYADDKIGTDTYKKRTMPILLDAEGIEITNSSHIIDYFMTLAKSQERREPDHSTLTWQMRAFPLIQKIGLSQWTHFSLGKYYKEKSHEQWASHKQTKAMKFNGLFNEKGSLVQQISQLLIEAESLLLVILHLSENQVESSLMDKAIIYSLLREFYLVTDIEWPKALMLWLQLEGNSLRPLYNDKKI